VRELFGMEVDGAGQLHWSDELFDLKVSAGQCSDGVAAGSSSEVL
jgi:hypothetical protein